MQETDKLLALMDKYSYNIIGPVMCEYTMWILTEAKKRGIKKLYFLARDGYTLFGIAKMLCSRYFPETECRYLCCSRYSLRIPSYHLIGEEALDLLLMKGCYLTPKSVLQRAGLDDAEIGEICRQTGTENENAVLSDGEFYAFAEKLRENKTYIELIKKYSEAAYEPAINYLKQEKLLDDDVIAVADSGWTGTMQRSLRILAESAGYKGRIVGFYFGMYTEPKEEADGEYLTFYFDRKKGMKRKVMFNNNLFECMLSAPHGMTMGYKYNNGKYVPILSEYPDNEMRLLTEHQNAGVLKYAEKYSETYDGNFDHGSSLKKCYGLLKRAMVYPEYNEAEMYGRFMFCDDVTESYYLSPTDSEMKDVLKEYLIVPRVMRKIFHIKSKASSKPLWLYGIIAAKPTWTRWWYRANIAGWDILRLLLKK